jgi:uncharacterized membrane protein
MNAYDTISACEAHFRAVLLPHRSLGRKGFIVLMTTIAGVSLAVGIASYAVGAWPVSAFLGLDALFVYGAFRLNYRAGRLYETVELTARELRLTRVHPGGRRECWAFNPYWVRLELEECEDTASSLFLRLHGRTLCFGHFLSNDEKRDFADALDAALLGVRSAPA